MRYWAEWERLRMFSMRMYIFIVGVFFFQSLFTRSVFAQDISQVVILNQVRGQECCEKGSVEALRVQFQTLRDARLPATFVFRFDALLNPQFTDLASQYPEFERGLFLEITPNLAQTAGVPYIGSESNWYTAKHAYLLGYTVEDRKKMIDTAMRAFYNAFHAYPKTTAAWMIDAWSLQYLSDSYHISAHEITRDQWGTDSYTLYGGPVGTSYHPSKQWPIIPAQGDAALPLTIFRQTLPDPLWNYGDTSSATTSQPNDYVLAGKTVQYFSQLLENTLLHQYAPQTVVLGLENSMNMETQKEFITQIHLLKKMLDEHNTYFTVKTAVDASKTESPNVSIQHGRDVWNNSSNQVPESWWIITTKYRARMIHTSTDLLLTDLRVYDPTLPDPYFSTPTRSQHAYWIVPFAVDGSRVRVKEVQYAQTLSFFRRIVTPIWRLPKTTSEPSDVFSDLQSSPVAVQFPRPKGEVRTIQENRGHSLNYQSDDGEEKVLFTDQDIRHIGYQPPRWNVVDEKIPQNTGAIVTIETKNNETTLTPLLVPAESQRWLMPESNTSPIDPKHSSMYVHNVMARFGRNPIRIVLILRDAQRLPTLPQTSPHIVCVGDACGSTEIQQDSSKGMYYIDLDPIKPGIIKLAVRIDETTYPLGYAWSAEDCALQKKRCLVNPLAVFGFGLTSLLDRLQLYE